MNRASVEAALAITPAVVGTYEWSADHRHLVVRHDVPFDTTTAYTVRLGGMAEDESGGTLDGDFDRVWEGSPADDFVWTFRFQIPNDDFADAQVLAGESGSIAGSNRYAFVEWEEPRWFATPTGAYGSSLWYRWAAATDGWFTFDLGPGSSFDSVLVVSTGDRLDELEGSPGTTSTESDVQSGQLWGDRRHRVFHRGGQQERGRLGCDRQLQAVVVSHAVTGLHRIAVLAGPRDAGREGNSDRHQLHRRDRGLVQRSARERHSGARGIRGLAGCDACPQRRHLRSDHAGHAARERHQQHRILRATD